jgi:hypothetical protein
MTVVKPEKINGISFVASREPISDIHIAPVVNLKANYAAIMPFGFIRDLNHPEVRYNSDRQWFGETISGAGQYIETFQNKNIKIMLKPHIWVSHGDYTGHIEMESEENWKTLEKSYSEFILEYAVLASQLNIDIFCIGTELEKFVENRPEYWKDLIRQIELVYDGELTYAANWDEFKRTPFWNSLDYIGVDAYFPVSDSQTPTIDECIIGWEEHKKTIEAVSRSFNKPVMFTEFGYRSVDYAGKEPWKSDRSDQVNLEAQINTTQALFDVFWHEDWFAGGFIWKWFSNYERSGGSNNSQFTPQNKPVEALIKEVFLKY